MKTHNKTVIGNRLELLRILKIMPKLVDMSQPELNHYYIIYDRVCKDFDYFVAYSQDDPDKVSYAQNIDILNPKTRIKTSFTRFLRRKMHIGNDMIGDQTLDNIGREVICNVTDINDIIKIEPASKILDYYCDSWGGCSCMTGEDNKKYLDLYRCNPDKIQILIYNNQVRARALLWKTEQGYVLDRIYPNDGGHINIIHEYCEANNITYRCDNHLPDGYVELSDDKIHTIVLNLPDDGNYPYLDTFQFGEIGNELHLSNDPDDIECTFDSTCGNYTSENDENYTNCESCGDSYSNDEISCIDDMCLCQDCFNESYSYCEHCEDHCPNDDIRMVNDGENEAYWCEDCACTNAYYCEKCGDYYTEAIEYNGDYYCNECAETELAICDNCDGYELASDIVHLESDDIYVCEYCASEAKRNQEVLDLECETRYKVLSYALRTDVPRQVLYDRL